VRHAPALALVAAFVVLASPALAHGPSGAGKGYVSTFSSIEPQVLGLQVRLVAGTDRLLVQNWSGKRVVILGYEGEPYLRFDARGVFWNARSGRPAAGASPSRPDPDAPPLWQRLSAGTSYAFADDRIGWAGAKPPDVVRRDPAHSHLIRNWRIPATADGKPIVVKGFLGYVPPPGAGSSGGAGVALPLGIAAGALVAAAATFSVMRRRRARRLGGRRAPATTSR
jgi:hypothetical protein